jgi:hypothetical protein
VRRYEILPNTFFNDYLAGPGTPASDQLIRYHSANTPVRDGKTSVQLRLERHLAMRARVLGSKRWWQPCHRECDKIALPMAPATLTSGKTDYVLLRPLDVAESQHILTLC